MARLGELAREAAGRLDGRVSGGQYSVDRFIVVGDTHGFTDATIAALRLAEREGADLIVFLGDYVDRGPEGVENLVYLLEAFVENRYPLVLLRGNHEDEEMNYYYGFRDEALAKAGLEDYRAVARLFRRLPIYTIVNGWLLVHGGVPCTRCRGGPEDPVLLSGFEEQRFDDTIGDSRLFQMVWNDPRGFIEWFEPNMRGPGTYYYGRAAWRVFLEGNGLRGIIRGHEVSDALQYWGPDGRHEALFPDGWRARLAELEGGVLTVFSSKYHGGRAGILVVEGGELVLHTV